MPWCERIKWSERGYYGPAEYPTSGVFGDQAAEHTGHTAHVARLEMALTSHFKARRHGAIARRRERPRRSGLVTQTSGSCGAHRLRSGPGSNAAGRGRCGTSRTSSGQGRSGRRRAASGSGFHRRVRRGETAPAARQSASLESKTATDLCDHGVAALGDHRGTCACPYVVTDRTAGGPIFEPSYAWQSAPSATPRAAANVAPPSRRHGEEGHAGARVARVKRTPHSWTCAANSGGPRTSNSAPMLPSAWVGQSREAEVMVSRELS